MTEPDRDREPDAPAGGQDASGPSRDPLHGIDPALDYDAAFADLVKRFGEPPAPDPTGPDQGGPGLTGPDPSGPEPTGPHQSGPDPIGPDRTGPDETGRARPGPEPSAAPEGASTATPGDRAWYPPELDEHFEPPDPPPLPRGDLVSRLAWAGVLGGPAVLLAAAILQGTLPSLLVTAALVAFITGFVTLVARMPADREDDGDDGAVV